MIEVTSNQPHIMHISRSDTYGGRRFDLTFSPEMDQMLEWYKTYKEQMLRESRAREQFESVAMAYEQYQTALKLVLDQV